VSSEEALSGGMRGKCVKVLHFYGDALWDASGRITPNLGFKGSRVYPLGGDEVLPSSGMGGGVMGVGRASVETQAQTQSSEIPDEEEQIGCGEGRLAVPSHWWQVLSMDDLFRAVLVQCLLKKRHLPPSFLPILPSTLFGTVMPGACPKGLQLHIKQTSWKKFGVFLEALVKEGLIMLDDEGRLESWDAQHPLILKHRAWPALEEHASIKSTMGGADVGVEFNMTQCVGQGGTQAAPECPLLTFFYQAPKRTSFVTLIHAVFLSKLFFWVHAVSEGLKNGGLCSEEIPPPNLPGIVILRKMKRGGPAASRSLGTKIIPLSTWVSQKLTKALKHILLEAVEGDGPTIKSDDNEESGDNDEGEETDTERSEESAEEKDGVDFLQDPEAQSEVEANHPGERSSGDEDRVKACVGGTCPILCENLSDENISNGCQPLSPSALAKVLLSCIPDLSVHGSDKVFFSGKDVGSLCSDYIGVRALADEKNKKNALLDVTLAQCLAPGSRGVKESPPTLLYTSTTLPASSSLVKDSHFAPQQMIPPLHELLLSLSVPAASLVHSPSLPRADISLQFSSKFTPFWSLAFNASSGDILVKSGPPPQVCVGRKYLQGGRRCITWCAGLEAFRMDPRLLCADLAKLLAASATLQPAAPLGFSIEGVSGESTAVVVQGDEVDRVKTFLVEKLGGSPSLVVVHASAR